jgi:hypothetical protein
MQTEPFSERLSKLNAAMSKAQGMVKAVAKGKVNPQFKSKYATLDDILEMLRPILGECELSVIQVPVFKDNLCGVKTEIRHSGGASIDCGELLLPLGRSGGAQGAGSSLTYARRYVISSIFCISADEDDDGNAAQKSKPRESQETKEIQQALKRFSDEHGLDAAKNIVKKLGAEKSRDLPKGSLSKVLEEIKNHEQ